MVSREDFALVSVSTLDSSLMRSDDDLYDQALNCQKENRVKHGLGLILIVHAGDAIPSSFVGNPLLEEDHEERSRVFFDNKETFFETLED